jgi:hypothetical protein
MTFLSVDEPPPQAAIGSDIPAAAAVPPRIRMKSRRSTPVVLFFLFTGTVPPFRSAVVYITFRLTLRVETKRRQDLFLISRGIE